MTDKQTDLTPQLPQVPLLGHDPGEQMKFPAEIFLYHLFVRRHSKFCLNIFEIDFVIEI